MKISYSWLKNYINIDLDPEKVSELLTDCGLEVEGLEKIQTVKGGLEGLVVGEVLSKEKHPDADRLNLTTVNIGGEEPLNIVCGAPNVEPGQKVVIAPIGTTLYSGDESFKIKKSKIRGQLSEGMICAEDEIGLGNSHDGIMILDSSVKVGTSVKEHFKVEDDYVFEIGLTPNRADATGHIGVARDLVAVLGISEKKELNKPSVEAFKVDNNNLKIALEIKEQELCPRYSAVTIDGVKVEDSPDWLKNRLLSIGLSPINNVVDITNFVLHETGQPLHAFDAKKIQGDKVIVSTVSEKTKFTTLDEAERELSKDDLMICNVNEPMCIAGVFGGIDSGVSNDTTSIFLESAYFNPVSIRKSAKRHGLNTDASFRFERGADPNNTIFALKRASLLIKEIAGGEISSDVLDYYPNPIENFSVQFSYENCDRLIGKVLDRDLIKNILTLLEIQIVKEDAEGLELSIPPFKVDVQREADVIEEILRVYGYNNVEIPEVLTSSLSYREKPDQEKVVNIISDLLTDNGFNEMLSNSLTKSDYYKNSDTLVRMKNPLSKELDVLRQSMVYNGLETIVYNQNRKATDLKLYEWGKTYFRNGKKFSENSLLSVFISGRNEEENWNTDSAEISFYDLKGVVNAILDRFGLTRMNLKISETEHSELEFGLNYTINNLPVVNFGKINSGLQKEIDIDNEVYYAEINLDNLLKLVAQNKVVYKEVSKFPAVRRDLALLLDSDVEYDLVESLAYKQDKKLLKEVNLFDVYEGKNLPEGKKSYGVSFKAQIDKVMSKIIKSYENELNAQLR
jgi:phenylalanyl-tRNA synthetase beta chain